MIPIFYVGLWLHSVYIGKEKKGTIARGASEGIIHKGTIEGVYPGDTTRLSRSIKAPSSSLNHPSARRSCIEEKRGGHSSISSRSVKYLGFRTRLSGSFEHDRSNARRVINSHGITRENKEEFSNKRFLIRRLPPFYARSGACPLHVSLNEQTASPLNALSVAQLTTDQRLEEASHGDSDERTFYLTNFIVALAEVTQAVVFPRIYRSR